MTDKEFSLHFEDSIDLIGSTKEELQDFITRKRGGKKFTLHRMEICV